jgi:molybdate transport system regulatory protein
MLRILGKESPAMGPGRAELITRIDRTGSISAAAREMGMSYRRAWQLVDALNASFKRPVIRTEIGGRRGGGATVTAFGRRLVERYRVMEDKASRAIAADLRAFSRHIRQAAPGSRRAK